MVKTTITDIEIGKSINQLQQDVAHTKTEIHKLNSRLDTVETRIGVVEEVNSDIVEKTAQFDLRLTEVINEQRQAFIFKWAQITASVVILIIIIKAFVP